MKKTIIFGAMCIGLSSYSGIDMSLMLYTNRLSWKNVDTRYGYHVQQTDSLSANSWTTVYSNLHSTLPNIDVNLDSTNNASFFRVVVPIWNNISTNPEYSNWGASITDSDGDFYFLYEKHGAFLRYSSESNAWFSLSNQTNSTWGFLDVWCNEKYYVFSGYQSTSTSVYDPNTDAWTQGSNCPLEGLPKGIVVGSNIYIIGGSGNVCYDDVYKYDVNSDEWIEQSPLPQARKNAAIVESDGHIYVIGGKPDFDALPTSTIYDYVISENRWYVRQNMPTPRGDASAIMHEGKIYVTGGWSSSSGGIVYINPAPFEVFDIASGTWQQGDDCPTFGVPIQKVIDSHLYVFQPARSAWKIPLSGGEWIQVLEPNVYGHIYVSRDTVFNAYSFGGQTVLESITY